jgi:uncharacterized membrane protein
VIVLEFVLAFVILVLAICNTLVGVNWFAPIAAHQLFYDREMKYDKGYHCFLFLANIVIGSCCILLLFLLNPWLIMFVPFFFIDSLKNNVKTIKGKIRKRILNFLNEDK